ncbi:glycosyltransferase family 2 protein [Verrucomicrobiota bacterium]
MTHEKKETSIIICTHNRKNDLIKCLSSIRSSIVGDFEILVVDNNSTDGTVDAIRTEFPEVHLIINDKNLGTAQSRNQAITVSHGKYIWFLDSDTELLSGNILSNMLDYFELHQDIGALGGQVVEEDGQKKYWMMGCIDSGKDEKILVDDGEPFEREVMYLPTCNCMVRKDLLYALGGFDVEYFYYCEDLDLGLKIRNSGLKNVFRSDCCVFHKFSQESRIGDYYLFERNLLRCLIINGSVFNFLFFIPWRLIRSCRVFIGLARKGNVIGNVRTIKESEKGVYSGIIGIARLMFRMLLSIIGAWVWNLIYLWKTLRVKFGKVNYLDVS